MRGYLHRRDQRLAGDVSFEAPKLFGGDHVDLVPAVHCDMLRAFAPDLGWPPGSKLLISQKGMTRPTRDTILKYLMDFIYNWPGRNRTTDTRTFSRVSVGSWVY